FCYPSPCTSSSTASSWLYTLSLHDALPISARTNRIIGGQAPSSYLESVQEEVGISPAQMDELLHSHAIDPGRLRDDDYFGFRDADRKSTRLNSSHVKISYAVFCLKKKTNTQ